MTTLIARRMIPGQDIIDILNRTTEGTQKDAIKAFLLDPSVNWMQHSCALFFETDQGFRSWVPGDLISSAASEISSEKKQRKQQ